MSITRNLSQIRDLASQWADLTAYRSNIGGLRNHPVFQELIALGEPAVPLILGGLERKPSATSVRPACRDHRRKPCAR